MAACKDCGCDLPVQTGRGRRRTYCEECSPARRGKATRRVPEVTALPPAAVVAADPVGIVRNTSDALEAAGRLETPDGAVALHMARLLEAGSYNAQGAKSLADAHAQSLERALKGAERVADAVDELRAKREQRRRGA